MPLDPEAKKALIERLRLGRQKKAAQKKAEQQPTTKAAPKPPRKEYKDLTNVVSDPVDLPEPEPVLVVEAQPATAVPAAPAVPSESPALAPAPNETTKEKRTVRDTKDKFLKIVWYKEPTKKQMQMLKEIEATSSDDEQQPPPPTKKSAARPAPVQKPKHESPTTEQKHRAYLKQLADMYF